jgi:uncharacterized membrane protein
VSGEYIHVDMNDLQADVPKFYSYRYQGTNINFFIVKSEGKVLSFLDACMKCYPKKLGFTADNGSVICRSCDERYPVSEIEKGFGSCYPVRLAGNAEGDRYLISLAEIERVGERFFR